MRNPPKNSEIRDFGDQNLIQQNFFFLHLVEQPKVSGVGTIYFSFTAIDYEIFWI